MVWVTTTSGTVREGRSIRNIENHWPRENSDSRFALLTNMEGYGHCVETQKTYRDIINRTRSASSKMPLLPGHTFKTSLEFPITLELPIFENYNRGGV